MKAAPVSRALCTTFPTVLAQPSQLESFFQHRDELGLYSRKYYRYILLLLGNSESCVLVHHPIMKVMCELHVFSAASFSSGSNFHCAVSVFSQRYSVFA
ncbi:hypothetical protein GMOD_00009989 [Pyrenophora seminiperda CCB06]|uniref:Uncharacterized protein n=1 Tax=Pyrenophora seminiperda CCB06 TaxID=1302712 RepID=A0A3M7M1L9_9PLEO|nr:hypothetical protein GMOD_00009989 [Pyrenophora seminiperda CCB06]